MDWKKHSEQETAVKKVTLLVILTKSITNKFNGLKKIPLLKNNAHDYNYSFATNKDLLAIENFVLPYHFQLCIFHSLPRWINN